MSTIDGTVTIDCEIVVIGAGPASNARTVSPDVTHTPADEAATPVRPALDGKLA